MTMWFCYERDFARRWCSVVYHGDRPGKSVTGHDRERTIVREVPTCALRDDGSPNLDALQLMFPAPVEGGQ